jgi:hypothetical protein
MWCLKDFAYWYADNTDADYDDIVRQVEYLVENISEAYYNKGYDKGYNDAVYKYDRE